MTQFDDDEISAIMTAIIHALDHSGLPIVSPDNDDCFWMTDKTIEKLEEILIKIRDRLNETNAGTN